MYLSTILINRVQQPELGKNLFKMSNEIFNKGIELGRERHAHILKRGSKWKSRFIPVFIREHLLVPYYITENGVNVELWIIEFPIGVSSKVGFVLFATVPYEASAIYAYTKPSG